MCTFSPGFDFSGRYIFGKIFFRWTKNSNVTFTLRRAPCVWSACQTQTLILAINPHWHSVDSTQWSSSLFWQLPSLSSMSNKDLFWSSIPLFDTACNMNWNSWKCRVIILLRSKYSLNWVENFPHSDIIYKWICENSYTIFSRLNAGSRINAEFFT